jgi:hypothetical protein
MRALLLAPLLAAACIDSGPVETRVCNRTGHPVTMFESSGLTDVELAADECTSYVTATRDVYRYTGVEFLIGSDRFEAHPADFVGETPLSAGRWSYEVRITDYAARRVATDAVED